MPEDKGYHIGIGKQELGKATLALIPGDPERVPRIAAKMDKAEKLGHHREFLSYRGYLDDQPVIICSTGIGGPSTTICVEELAKLGIRDFIRVGTTGAIQSHVAIGDLIVTQAAVRLDGASQHFAPLEYPAVADFTLTSRLVAACHKLGYPAKIGITASSDTFYPGQERYDTFSGRVVRRFRGSLEEWRQLGVLNFEMESASLFTMCSSMGLRAGCIGGVIATRIDSEYPATYEVIQEIEDKLISAALEAARCSL
jgi:uridine phosphorylase